MSITHPLGTFSRPATDLPLIDVSELRKGDKNRLHLIAHEIGAAAREIGFFRIIGHGIDPALIERTYRMAERFFALPERTKQEYYIGLSTNHRGYVPFSEKGDYADEVHRSYEAFDLALDLPDDDPDYLAGNRLLGPNVWPQLRGFRETLTDYYEQISGLGRQICGALEIHLGLSEGRMTKQMSKPISQLRLLHYVRDRQTTDVKSVNMGAHTDYECLTVLHTRNAGLQVMTAEDRWIDVPVHPGAFVINIGDMLEAWSNGILRSTPHRVLNLSRERFSLPYFLAANYHTRIEPFRELLGADGRSRYVPFLAGEHLERMLRRDFPYLKDLDRAQNMDLNTLEDQVISNPFEKRMNSRRN